MTNFLLLFLCLGIGFILRRTPFFDEKSPVVLNNLIVYFFIPVLTLYHVPKIDFDPKLIWLTVTPFIIYLSGLIFIRSVNQFNFFDKKTEGALIMTSGIGSTSFVGFPIFEMLFGAEGLSFGIFLSLAGTIIVFNTVGISTGLYYAGSNQKPGIFFRKLFTFPPLVAFITAIIINLSGIQFSPELETVLEKLSAPFSVLALLTIGMQMNFSLDKKYWKGLMVGQFYKLILAPVLIYVLMWHFLEIRDLTAKICILGAAIGSMNSISIVSAQLGLNPKLSVLMPALGIPISIPWLLLIDYIFLT